MLKTVTALVFLGFPVALVLAWAYELTPGGLVRDTPVAHSSARRLDVFIIFLVLGVVMIVIAVGMLIYFRRRKWL